MTTGPANGPDPMGVSLRLVSHNRPYQLPGGGGVSTGPGVRVWLCETRLGLYQNQDIAVYTTKQILVQWCAL